MIKKIDRLLVANRGEIAIRIFRAASDLSIKTVGVYSKEDKFNLFRMKADEAYLLGENRSPLAAYLDIDLIIDLAKKEKIDAIHPGYGFLSENANFARACEEAGIQFVGPPSHVLSQMGDKIKAKELAKRCNVPTIPGSEKPISSVEEAKQLAREYGLPVMFKAAAGGGGRGMRLIEHEDEIEAAFEMVKSEAHKAFGNTRSSVNILSIPNISKYRFWRITMVMLFIYLNVTVPCNVAIKKLWNMPRHFLSVRKNVRSFMTMRSKSPKK